MKPSWFLLALALTGCGSAAAPIEDPTGEAEPTGSVARPEVSSRPKPALNVSVVMTAATLGDDCGGSTDARPPPVLGKNDRDRDEPLPAKSKRRCEQTSMQLSIASEPGNLPARLLVKKVELFDEAGQSVAVLSSSAPTIWDESGTYVPWDERIAPSATLAVSYALEQPVFGDDAGRDKTYVIKAVVSVDGVDRSLSKEVVLSTRTTRPPMVKT